MQIERSLHFSDFQFNTSTNLLTYRGKLIELQHKPSQVLALLLASPRELITRDEIIETVWGKQVVDFDQNINFCIKCIRKALNDDPRRPQFVQTVPRMGYRFIADLQEKPSTVVKKSSKQYLHKFLKLPRKISHRLLWLLIASILAIIIQSNVFRLNPPKHSNNISDHAYQELRRAQYLLAKGDFQSMSRSIPIFEAIVQNGENSADAYSGLAIATLFAGANMEQRRRAIEYAQQAYKKNKNNGDSHLAMGLMAFYLNWNMPKAHKYLLRATQLTPQSILAWHELSVVQTIRGDFEGAEASIQRALAIDPGRYQEIFHAGWFYLASGQYGKALEQCLKSIEIAPSHSYSHLCIIDAASFLKLTPTVEQHIDKYMKLWKESDIFIDKWMAKHKTNQVTAFHQWRLQKLNKLGTDNFQAALIHARLNQNEAALSALENAVKHRHLMVPTAWAFNEFTSLRNKKAFTKVMSQVKR